MWIPVFVNEELALSGSAKDVLTCCTAPVIKELCSPSLPFTDSVYFLGFGVFFLCVCGAVFLKVLVHNIIKLSIPGSPCFITSTFGVFGGNISMEEQFVDVIAILLLLCPSGPPHTACPQSHYLILTDEIRVANPASSWNGDDGSTSTIECV